MKFRARVVRGKGRGRRIGIPTVNLVPPPNFPAKEGIWACWVSLNEKKCAGAMHWGPVPVFGEKSPSLEVHLLEAAPEIPEELTVELVAYLRPVRNFENAEKLREQVEEDIRRCKEILGLQL